MFAKLVLILFSLLSISSLAETRLSTGEDLDSYVDGKIDGSDVVVFAKSYCGFCKRTLETLNKLHDEMDFSMEVVQLNQLPEKDGPSVQMELLTRTGQRTVPSIFIGGEHVGGNSDLESLVEANKLRPMLQGVCMNK